MNFWTKTKGRTNPWLKPLHSRPWQLTKVLSQGPNIVFIKRSRKVFLFCGCCASCCDLGNFVLSVALTHNQGYTARFQQSKMSALTIEKKPKTDTSNKSPGTPAPHPPLQYGNNHTLGELHDGFGNTNYECFSKILMKEVPTASPLSARNASVYEDVLPDNGSWQNLRWVFRLASNLCLLHHPCKISENVWPSLRTSESLCNRNLAEAPSGTSWAKPLQEDRKFWKPNDEPHSDSDWGADWIGQSYCGIAAAG